MSYQLTAQSRTDLGRAAKRLHDRGLVPAVVYGAGTDPQSVSVNASEFRQVYRKAGTSSLIDLTVEGGAPVKALIKEVQVFPITMEPFHVDFQRIRMDREMTVEVPLTFVGESKAVKEFAGTLVKSLATIQIRCLPADLPHHIEVDLAPLATFDDMISVGTLPLPKGVTAVTTADVTIATVTPPLTEEQLKKLEEGSGPADVTAIKTEAEEKKAAEEAKKAEEAAAEKK
jgi:large subunit ribosomal protein L25